MRRWLILQTLWLLMLTATINTKAQEPGVKERARQYEPLIAASAARHGVDPRLLWTIAYLESRFRPAAISYKDGSPCAFGMMQFVPTTAARYGLVNPHDPAQAIESAARYVRDLTKRFGNDMRLVLAAYNSGEGTVEAYLMGRRLVLPTGKIINHTLLKTDGVPPYRETQGYVAGGTAIYRNISTAGIFSSTRRVQAPARQQSSPLPSNAAPEEAERSMYMTSPTIPAIAEESQKLPSDLQTDPPASERTRSIYIP